MAHDADREDDRDGDQRRHGVGDHARRDAAAAGEIAVESHVHHGAQPQQCPGDDGRGEDGERHDVAVRHGDDAAEQVGREVAGGCLLYTSLYASVCVSKILVGAVLIIKVRSV